MAINDEGVDHKIFEAVVVSLDNKVIEPPKAVAVSAGEVSLRGHVVVVPVDRRCLHRGVCQECDFVVVPVYRQAMR